MVIFNRWFLLLLLSLTEESQREHKEMPETYLYHIFGRTENVVLRRICSFRFYGIGNSLFPKRISQVFQIFINILISELKNDRPDIRTGTI